MDNILIEAEINSKHVKFMKILAIIYIVFVITIPIGILFLLMANGLKSQKLIVTKENIQGQYGSLIKGTIDLPLDSINSIECYEKTGNILISTSSKTIRFQSLTNAKAVTDAINGLIKNRNKGTTIVNNAVSEADELKKYKELLDSGIITQEEFDAKKKAPLGL